MGILPAAASPAYQVPLRDHSNALNNRHDSSYNSRRNSYRSIRSQKAIQSSPNHFGDPLESTSKSIILDDLDIVELDSTDDFDLRSIDSRNSRKSRGRAKSQTRSINDVIEEKIEMEVERRVKEEVAQMREQLLADQDYRQEK